MSGFAFSALNKFKAIIFYFLTFSGSVLLGQSSATPNFNNNNSIADLKEAFKPRANSYHLLNGRKHTFVYQPARGNPYLLDMLWQSGKVIADNFEFDSVLITYEILNDLLLMNYFSTEGSTIIALNGDNIQEFSLGKKSFINLQKAFPSVEMDGIFYEKLYQGKTGLYLRYEKTISSGSNVVNEYRLYETLYLLTDNALTPIKNNRKMYKALSYKKKELKQFAKENLSYFTIENHQQVIDLIKYYDEIN